MEPKTYLGRYRITLDQYGQPIRLRRDGNAVTYKGFDAESSREVALEIIPAGTVRISVQSKLQAEADAAKRLQQINIPMLYEFGIENNELIYAMEMVDGVSAQEWVATHGPMPIGSALRIAAQVVNALGAATFHGIFHHALNPANIMIVPGQTAEGEWPLVKVLNFIGVAPNYSRPSEDVAAKIDFVAPEQLESGGADFPSEIYSLGATLWFLLSGEAPVAGAAAVEEANRVPAPVRHLVSAMLASDPQERPRDPVALHDKIEDCIAEVENKRVILPGKPAPVVAPEPVAVATPPIVTAPRRPFPWQPLAVAAVLLLLGLLGAMVLPGMFRSRHAQKEIGVPVGVPDSVAARAATNAPPPPAAASTASDAPVVQPTGALVSTAGADENAESSSTLTNADEPAVSRPVTQPAIASHTPATPAPVATSSPVEIRTTPAPVIARSAPAGAQAQEPAPPSEGPDQLGVDRATESNPSYANVSRNQPDATPAVASQSSTAPAREEIAAATPSPARKQIAAAKPTPRPVRRPSVVASSTRLRGGNVRAQFLGTTPEGELIFGLPSDERGYMAPGRPRKESPSRNRRRETVRPAEPPDDLPVLPALPPDE